MTNHLVKPKASGPGFAGPLKSYAGFQYASTVNFTRLLASQNNSWRSRGDDSGSEWICHRFFKYCDSREWSSDNAQSWRYCNGNGE